MQSPILMLKGTVAGQKGNAQDKGQKALLNMTQNARPHAKYDLENQGHKQRRKTEPPCYKNAKTGGEDCYQIHFNTKKPSTRKTQVPMTMMVR